MIEIGKKNTLTAARQSTVGVYLEDKKGNEVVKTLKAKVKPVKVTETDIIEINDSATEQQVMARKAWLGIN